MEDIEAIYSWKILDDKRVLKNIDKSIFSRESGIPQVIRQFFDIEDLEQNNKIKIEMISEGKLYIGTLVNRNERTKINWLKDFGTIIDVKFKDWKNLLDEKSSNDKEVPQIIFEKNGHNKYKIILQCPIQETVIIEDIEDEEKTDTEIVNEGGLKLVFSKVYERKPKNRAMAIKIHGTQCKGCGFDFEKKYGQLGKEFIEIHHIMPLSHIGEEKEINPETDLIPLCSNCHRMIHRLIRKSKGKFTSLDDFKKIINQKGL